ncbi:MAG: signal peptide peptidase SppA [Bacteroidales bacterium]|nr:signal peptide peptidase SppA [Bacteroidales bacterium]
MKSFFKNVFATVVGIIISTIFLVLIGIGIVAIIVARQNRAVEIEPKTILVMELDNSIVERKPSLSFDIMKLSTESKTGLNIILSDIKKARKDANIKGIFLNLSVVTAGIGTIEEIRNALLEFRKSGKFVIAYGETFSQGAYYLATAADEVYMSPVGMMEWTGLRAQSPFFKGTLDKLDIEVTLIRHGKFKSAGETYTRDGFSTENREQIHRLISSYWDHILNNVGEARGLERDELNEIADKLLVGSTQAAYEKGLIDSLLYEDQVIGILKRKAGLKSADELRTVDPEDYFKVPETKKFKGVAEEKIAVIYAEGDIVSGEGDEQNIGSARFAKAIRTAREDKTVRAVVLRINSPGGSAIASEAIWRELLLTKQAKPLVVSMGSMAASGGYYIACMADSIFAQPTTLTGSIGVWGVYLNTEGLFDKIGVSFDVDKTNSYADALSGVRKATPFEINFWQATVDSMYTTFVKRVDQGRELTFDEIDALGQGRVWSGKDALENGLVDRMGGLYDAIEAARKLAKLGDRYRLLELPELESPLEVILGRFLKNNAVEAMEQEIGINMEYLRLLKKLYMNQGIMCRLPYDLTVY